MWGVDNLKQEVEPKRWQSQESHQAVRVYNGCRNEYEAQSGMTQLEAEIYFSVIIFKIFIAENFK